VPLDKRSEESAFPFSVIDTVKYGYVVALRRSLAVSAFLKLNKDYADATPGGGGRVRFSYMEIPKANAANIPLGAPANLSLVISA
jgi:hypothetical protein